MTKKTDPILQNVSSFRIKPDLCPRDKSEMADSEVLTGRRCFVATERFVACCLHKWRCIGDFWPNAAPLTGCTMLLITITVRNKAALVGGFFDFNF